MDIIGLSFYYHFTDAHCANSNARIRVSVLIKNCFYQSLAFIQRVSRRSRFVAFDEFFPRVPLLFSLVLLISRTESRSAGSFLFLRVLLGCNEDSVIWSKKIEFVRRPVVTSNSILP